MNISLPRYQKILLFSLVAFMPLLVWGQAERASEQSSIEARQEASAEAQATNVCDGVTCSDGSCAATADECVAEEQANESVCNGYLCDSGECVTSAAMCGITDVVAPIADSVCNGYLCDDGQCVSSAAMCGIDFDFEVDVPATAIDSVCNGYLCDDGTCMSSEAMCGLPLSGVTASAAKCPVGSPIRCGDGSCSNSVDRCLAIEKDLALVKPACGVDGNCDDDSDDDNNNRAQDYNSSRSNKPSSVAADDIVDDDSDGEDDAAVEAQDYNATRSNKPGSLFDGAGNRPGVSLGPNGFRRMDGGNMGEDTEGTSDVDPVKGDDWVHCWGQAEDEEGKLYSWGQGICVALNASDSRSATATARIAALQVTGDEVRSWSEEERTAWQEYRAKRATTSPEEQLAEQMITQTQANERIKEIRADAGQVEMRYQARLNLFGFIPMEREVKAKSNAAGAVEIEYPWYSFLSSKPDSDTMKNIINSLFGGGGGAGKATFQDFSIDEKKE